MTEPTDKAGAAGPTADEVRPRRKQVYKITYPNGKIYVGMDLLGTISYFGSPSRRAKDRMNIDLAEYRLDLTARKEILWESDTANDTEVRAIERDYIRSLGANNPDIGYNLVPRYRPDREEEGVCDVDR